MPCSPNHTSLPSFDELKTLAETDLDQLEQLRHQLSMELIDSLPKNHQEYLRAQQNRINRIIERGNNPNHVNILLGQELSKQFMRFSDSLNNPLGEIQTAEIIQFPDVNNRVSNNTKH